MGSAYPAVSQDNGKSWTINGPMFVAPIADGAAATSQLLTTSDGTLIAWGRGGNLVEMTSDGGRRWIEAVFPGGVDAVRVQGSRIIVRALGVQLPPGNEAGPFATWIYQSSDDGRRWSRSTRSAPVPP